MSALTLVLIVWVLAKVPDFPGQAADRRLPVATVFMLPGIRPVLFVTLGFGAIGFLDDYDKVKKRSTQGVSGRVRLLFEFLIAGIASWLLVTMGGNTHLYVPFYNGPVIDLSYGYILFAAFTIVAI